MTKKTVTALSVSASTGTDGNGLEAELEEARTRARNLFIAVVSLAAATALLLLSLVFSCVRNRKSSPAHPAYILRGVFEKATEEQGHTYDNPFNPAASAKQGGYAPVQT